MAISRRLLGDGETVVVHTRTHGKALVGPAALLVVLAGLTGAALAAVPSATGSWARTAILVLALVAVGYLCGRPFVRWLTSSYTVTDRRVLTRTGIVHRRGRTIPLQQVTDVSYDRSLADRVFGCGTLHVATASEQAPLVLPDVPEIERVHRAVAESAVEHPDAADRTGRSASGHRR